MPTALELSVMTALELSLMTSPVPSNLDRSKLTGGEEAGKNKVTHLKEICADF